MCVCMCVCVCGGGLTGSSYGTGKLRDVLRQELQLFLPLPLFCSYPCRIPRCCRRVCGSTTREHSHYVCFDDTFVQLSVRGRVKLLVVFQPDEVIVHLMEIVPLRNVRRRALPLQHGIAHRRAGMGNGGHA